MALIYEIKNGFMITHILFRKSKQIHINISKHYTGGHTILFSQWKFNRNYKSGSFRKYMFF